DGVYRIETFATSIYGVSETVRPSRAYLDGTPPSITIIQPAATTYPHSGTLTLDYTVTDAGSGVQSSTAKMDDAPTLPSGQAIHLLTLALGTHRFTVDALDNVGNAESVSVAFSIIVTPDSIKDDVAQFLAGGNIAKRRFTYALLRKLGQGAVAQRNGHCERAAKYYEV